MWMTTYHISQPLGCYLRGLTSQTILVPTIIRASTAKRIAARRKCSTVNVLGVKPSVFALSL